MARRPKDGFLAPAIKLRTEVCNNRLRNFACFFTGRQRVNESNPTAAFFYHFHVYFTTRRILYAVGGISSKSPFPDDPTFNNKYNPYDIVSYKKICAEFGVSPSSDFRYTHGKNHGLGNVFIDYNYPGEPDLPLFSDERSKDDDRADVRSYVRNMQGADSQFEHFIPNYVQRLSQPGLLRLNQSIEAFVYCVLGAQVGARSSIIGNGGEAAKAQSQFLVLFEGEIRSPDFYKECFALSGPRQKCKDALGLCGGPCVLAHALAHDFRHTESIVGYSNKLKQATQWMKLWVNTDVNQGTKKSFTATNGWRP